MHAPLAHFEESWTHLDKICLQKQNKTTFKTNGSWDSREQLEKYPCGIIIRAVSPSLYDITSNGGMGTIQVEYQIRLSERNKPGAEVVVPLPGNAMSNPQ